MSIFSDLSRSLHRFNDTIKIATDNINRWKHILETNPNLTPAQEKALKHNISIAVHNLEGAYKSLAIDPSGIIDGLTDGIGLDAG